MRFNTNIESFGDCPECDRMERELKKVSERLKAKETELHAANMRIEELVKKNLEMVRKYESD